MNVLSSVVVNKYLNINIVQPLLVHFTPANERGKDQYKPSVSWVVDKQTHITI